MSTPGPDGKPGGGAPGGRSLSTAEFAARFQEASRVLWTIAAGVLGDPAEAEDVLQEAAMMALVKREQFEPGTSFSAWMGRFVRNVALNHARKVRRRGTLPHAPEVVEEIAGTGSRAPILPGPGTAELPVDGRGELLEDQTAFDDRVLAGLRELGPDPRAALLLRTVMGLTYREIALTLEIPEGTAMSHVHRARTLLRERLGPDEPPASRGPEERP
jgi:RNA polymerase sigma-70 factor (ECF subfamily)